MNKRTYNTFFVAALFLANSGFANEDPITPSVAPKTAKIAATQVPTPTAAEIERNAKFLRALQRIRTTARSGTQASAGVGRPRHSASASARLPDDARIWRRPGWGTPRQIRGARLAAAAPGSGDSTVRARTTSRAFLRRFKRLMKLRNPDEDVVLEAIQADNLNRKHLRFGLRHRGLQVWPADLIVSVNGNGDVDHVSASYPPIPRKLVVRPSVSAKQARKAALATVIAPQEAGVKASELIIYAKLGIQPRLAWKFRVRQSPRHSWIVVIDAHSGTKLDAFNEIMNDRINGRGQDIFNDTRPLKIWREDDTRYLVDTSKRMYQASSNPPNPDPNITRGAIIVQDARNRPTTNPPDRIPNLFHVTSDQANSGWLRDGVSAAFNLSETYDYFEQRHQRNSLDGQGGTISAIVRFGNNYDNAFWDPNLNLIVFGDASPYAGSLDIVAHELTHGVISSTANLVYQNQSGALNEAFADIFGEMVEADSRGSPDWIIGSDLGFPLRNMKDPGSLRICRGCPAYPSKMSEFIPPTDPLAASDNGGVHINSSIINRAYYLLAAGLDRSIGLNNASRIFYRALTTKLTSQSEFVDLRLAAIASAKELFGDDSRQARQTANAFDAVEILDAPPTPAPPTNPQVSGDDATIFVYADNAGNFFLGRRESARGDGANGVALSQFDIERSRASVTGDGELAIFVDSLQDTCFILTDGLDAEDCVGNPDTVYSVAVSPDGELYAIVFLDEQGFPTNEITMFNLRNDRTNTFRLPAPLIDGGSVDVLFADALDFSVDGKTLIYDAFNQLRFQNDDTFGLWSIYAFDVKTESVSVVIPPASGLDISFPSFAQTSPTVFTYEAVQPSGDSTIYAADLFSGRTEEIIRVANANFAIPSYSGDDRHIIYSVPDGFGRTGASLERVPVGPDHITRRGSASLWLADADFGVIYRRGEFSPPQNATLTINPTGTGSGLVTSIPSGIVCGSSCNAEYTKGSKVTLVPAPANGSAFAGWEGAGCKGEPAECEVDLSRNKTVTAKFDRAATLTITLAGDGSGTVTSTPAGISCGNQCTHDFAKDSNVTIRHNAANRSAFVGWDGAGCAGETGNCVVTLSRSKTVKARFAKDNDNDGLSNDDENRLGTDPENADTDGDGMSDGEEARRGEDPRVNPFVLDLLLRTIILEE